jgi:hypothetical protein
MPAVYRGEPQIPLSGISMRYTFDAKPDAPTQKHRQYYEMLGTRAMWEDGWKAAAIHAPAPSDKGRFDKDVWELYNTDEDRSESRNLAKEHPEKLQSLIKAWFDEAQKNWVLPLDDRSAVEILGTPRPSDEPPRERYIYYPGAIGVPEGAAANTRGRSYKILADVEITDAHCSGVIFAQGSRFGGHTLFIKDKKLYYVYNFLGIEPEQKFVSSELEPGKYTVGMEFIREGAGPNHESQGKTTLFVNDKPVAQGPMRMQVGKFSLAGDRLCVGFASGDPISQELKSPSRFTGGTILGVAVTVEKAQYLDLEKEAMAAFAADSGRHLPSEPRAAFQLPLSARRVSDVRRNALAKSPMGRLPRAR